MFNRFYDTTFDGRAQTHHIGSLWQLDGWKHVCSLSTVKKAVPRKKYGMCVRMYVSGFYKTPVYAQSSTEKESEWILMYWMYRILDPLNWIHNKFVHITILNPLTDGKERCRTAYDFTLTPSRIDRWLKTIINRQATVGIKENSRQKLIK